MPNKNVLVFSGSTRAGSVNKKLAAFAASKARDAGADVTLVDLGDYVAPVYNQDDEMASGLPQSTKEFKAMVASHDALLIARIAELEAQIAMCEAERALTERHLEIIDELDLEAFNNRDMKRTGEIYAENVVVHNPEGTQTAPWEPRGEELQFLFDTFEFKVTDHIVGFGYGEWTAGISISAGTWVKLITLKDGTVLEPTGKQVRLKIATIARWENGRIAEEYLIWDNQDWNQQIGLSH